MITSFPLLDHLADLDNKKEDFSIAKVSRLGTNLIAWDCVHMRLSV